MTYFIFAMLLLLCSPVGYFLGKRIFFYIRYGFVVEKFPTLSVRVPFYLINKIQYYLPDICNVPKYHMYEIYMIKLRGAGYDTEVMKDILFSTDISIRSEILWNGNPGSGIAEWAYALTQWKKKKMVVISLAYLKSKNPSSTELAKLIFHELLHHYLMVTEGDPDGKSYKGNHNHPIWKIVA